MAELVHRGLNPAEVPLRMALLYSKHKEDLWEEHAAAINYGFTGERGE